MCRVFVVVVVFFEALSTNGIEPGCQQHIEDEQNKFCVATSNQPSAQESINTIKLRAKMTKDLNQHL